jgi:hypothetical protein
MYNQRDEIEYTNARETTLDNDRNGYKQVKYLVDAIESTS